MTGPSLIQNHNIERVLGDHLWDEVRATRERIADLSAQVAALGEREQRLVRIAEAADIPEPFIPAEMPPDKSDSPPTKHARIDP